jgi:glycosyltransferase involved in cell wall biosynthesis
MHKNHPFISIVTPSFNQGDFIEETILSVLEQNYPMMEHIIVDGGSTDKTIDILKKFSHLTWISEIDGGQSDAINKGFRMAKGEILAWLCSDDIMKPHVLVEVGEAINPALGRYVVVGRSEWIDEKGKVLNPHPFFGSRDHRQMVRFWKYHPLPQPSVFFHRKVFEEFGPLSIDESLAMDYDFWLKISQRYFFYSIDSVFSQYRLHNASKCMTQHLDAHWDLSRLSQRYWGAKNRMSYWTNWLSYHLSRDLNRPEIQQGLFYLNEGKLHLKNGWINKGSLSLLKALIASPWVLTLGVSFRSVFSSLRNKAKRFLSKGYFLLGKVFTKRLDLVAEFKNARIEAEAPHFVSTGFLQLGSLQGNALFTHPYSMVTFVLRGKRWKELKFGLFLHPDVWEKPGSGVTYEVAWNGNPIFKRNLNPKLNQKERSVFFFTVPLPENNSHPNILKLRASASEGGDNRFCFGGWLNPYVSAEKKS